MDITQAHKEFQLFMDKVDSESLPEFLPSEIDTFIHEAELRIVKQAYGGNNIYKSSYGSTQKRTDDISTLIRTAIIEFIDNKALFPTDYMFLDRVMIGVSTDTISKTYTSPYLCSSDKLNNVLSDPFNKSRVAYPVVWIENNSLLIDTPNFTAEDAKLTYIKYPVRVNKKDGVSSELPEQKQREAIQMAVRIALGVVESQRIEEQNQQLGTME
jgi:hypothetical protein